MYRMILYQNFDDFVLQSCQDIPIYNRGQKLVKKTANFAHIFQSTLKETPPGE